MAISPDGRYVYALAYNGNNRKDVWVVDTARNAVTSNIPLNSGNEVGIAVAPDGRHLYVTDPNSVTVIDVEAMG